jgi:transcription initiation factor IIE alpha subunit
MEEQSENPPQVVANLVRLVMRAFYEQEHIIIVDYLLKEGPQNELDLAKSLNVQPKFLKSKLVELKADYLLQNTTVAQKKSSKQIVEIVTWHINFKLFIDTVKYRFDRLRKDVKALQQTVELYACMNCGFEYGAYEIHDLYQDGQFICSHCKSGVVDEITAASGGGGKGLEEKIDTDLARIFTNLKLTEGYVIPQASLMHVGGILTKANAQRKIHEDQQQQRILENMGGHAHARKSTSSAGALGGSGTGHKMGTNALMGDRLNVVVEGSDGNASSFSAEENAKKQAKRQQDKKKELTPYFLQREQSTDDSILSTLNVGSKNTNVTPFDEQDSALGPPSKRRKIAQEIDEQAQAELQLYLQQKKDQEEQLKQQEEAAAVAKEEEDFSNPELEGVVVTVQGVPKGINDVTDTDKENMTAEEYRQYMSYMHDDDDNY